jgi:hypothetical protein
MVEVTRTGSEQFPFLRRCVSRITQEVLGDINGPHEIEEAVPRLGAAGQNDVSRVRIATNIDFRSLKAVFSRQADCLTAAVAEQFGSSWHGIDYDIYPK